MIHIPIHYFNSSPDSVEQILNQLLETSWYIEAKCHLEILALEFEVNIMDYKYTENGYPELNTLASCNMFNDKSELIFYKTAISEQANILFSKVIHSSIASQFLEAFIKYVLVHELVHVKQIKNDGLSYEIYNQTSYKENQFEYEANQYAFDYLVNKNRLNELIIPMIHKNEMIPFEFNKYFTEL